MYYQQKPVSYIKTVAQVRLLSVLLSIMFVVTLKKNLLCQVNKPLAVMLHIFNGHSFTIQISLILTDEVKYICFLFTELPIAKKKNKETIVYIYRSL